MELFNSNLKIYIYFVKRILFIYTRIPFILGNGNPAKISYIFPKESFSYISEMETP